MLNIGDHVIDVRTHECGEITGRILSESGLKVHLYQVEFTDSSVRAVTPQFLLEISYEILTAGPTEETR